MTGFYAYRPLSAYFTGGHMEIAEQNWITSITFSSLKPVIYHCIFRLFAVDDELWSRNLFRKRATSRHLVRFLGTYVKMEDVWVWHIRRPATKADGLRRSVPTVRNRTVECQLAVAGPGLCCFGGEKPTAYRYLYLNGSNRSSSFCKVLLISAALLTYGALMLVVIHTKGCVIYKTIDMI